MGKVTCLGSLSDLSSPLYHSATECSKSTSPKINLRRKSILFLYLKDYQVFFKEALKIFEKKNSEGCMLQCFNTLSNLWEEFQLIKNVTFKHVIFKYIFLG